MMEITFDLECRHDVSCNHLESMLKVDQSMRVSSGLVFQARQKKIYRFAEVLASFEVLSDNSRLAIYVKAFT